MAHYYAELGTAQTLVELELMMANALAWDFAGIPAYEFAEMALALHAHACGAAVDDLHDRWLPELFRLSCDALRSAWARGRRAPAPPPLHRR